LVDLIQGSILKNYAVFSFVVRYAPQKLGADACYYRAFKEFLIACRRVPGYSDFLRKRGWSCASSDPKEILRSLPLTDKPDYILAYSTEQRLFRCAKITEVGGWRVHGWVGAVRESSVNNLKRYQ
jgi:hypothetical protein